MYMGWPGYCLVPEVLRGDAVMIDTREYFHVTLLPDRIESHLDKEWNEKSGYYDHSPTLDRLIAKSTNNILSLTFVILGIASLISSFYFNTSPDLLVLKTLTSVVLLIIGYLYWDRGD
jgi:hypothetical protein